MRRCCKYCVGCCSVLVVAVAVLVGVVKSRGFLLLNDFKLMPCPVGTSSNNLIVSLSKVGHYKLNNTNNFHDAAVFPPWLGAVGEAMAKGSAQKPPELSNNAAAVQHRIRRGSEAVANDIGKVEQVVYIGAGFDMKMLPFVEDPAHAEKRFFEMDLPDVAGARRCLLDNWNSTVSQRIDVRGGDLYKQTVHEVFGNISFDVPSLYLEEATFVYIEVARRMQIVKDLLLRASCGSIFHFYTACSADWNCISPMHFKGLDNLQQILDGLAPGHFVIKAWPKFWMYDFDPNTIKFMRWMMDLPEELDSTMIHSENQSMASWEGLVNIVKTC